jgi:hypothetical protein
MKLAEAVGRPTKTDAVEANKNASMRKKPDDVLQRNEVIADSLQQSAGRRRGTEKGAEKITK